MPEMPMNQNAGDPAGVAALNEQLADPDFVERFNAGDTDARKIMHHLHLHAYPGTQADESHGSSVAQVAHEESAPDSPGGYRFRYQPGVDVDVSGDRAIREVAHAAGLPQSLARQLHTLYTEAENKPRPDSVTIELQARSAEAKLRARWGDQYDTRMALAKSVLKSVPSQHSKTVDRIFIRAGSDQHLIERLAFFAERRALNIRRG